MKTKILGDFQICISIPLRRDIYGKMKNLHFSTLKVFPAFRALYLTFVGKSAIDTIY